MAGLLLDTHALYWLVSGTVALDDKALVEIGLAQQAGTLFLSPITAWELSVAAGKRDTSRRPDLGEMSADRWFRRAHRAIDAKLIPIRQRIALQAANVVVTTGHKDPGDCFLIATAIASRLSLVTRDRAIQAIAHRQPDDLTIIPC